MRVFLAKRLSQDFASTILQQKFVDDFKSWQSKGRPCNFRRFGKCVTTTVPIGHDFDHLWHCHLIPEDEASLERWELSLMSKTEHRRCNRQSDSLLFFAEYKGNFLLIRRTSHDLMRPPRDKLDAVCVLADAWVKSLRAKP